MYCRNAGADLNAMKHNFELMQCYGSSRCVNSERPVWVLRHDVKFQQRQRLHSNCEGSQFDQQEEWMENINNRLDEPLKNLSASSLPQSLNEPDTSLSYDYVSHILIPDLVNKSSSAPVLKKLNNSSEHLYRHVTKVCIYIMYVCVCIDGLIQVL